MALTAMVNNLNTTMNENASLFLRASKNYKSLRYQLLFFMETIIIRNDKNSKGTNGKFHDSLSLKSSHRPLTFTSVAYLSSASVESARDLIKQIAIYN